MQLSYFSFHLNCRCSVCLELYTDYQCSLKGPNKNRSVVFHEMHEVAVKIVNKLDGLVLVGRDYERLLQDHLLLAGLQSNLTILDMAGWSQKNFKTALKIVDALLNNGKLQHLCIRHASELNISMWQQILSALSCKSKSRKRCSYCSFCSKAKVLPKQKKNVCLNDNIQYNNFGSSEQDQKVNTINPADLTPLIESAEDFDGNDSMEESGLYDLALSAVKTRLSPLKRYYKQQNNFNTGPLLPCSEKHCRGQLVIKKQNNTSVNKVECHSTCIDESQGIDVHNRRKFNDLLDNVAIAKSGNKDENYQSLLNNCEAKGSQLTGHTDAYCASCNKNICKGLVSIRFRDISSAKSIFGDQLLTQLPQWTHLSALELSAFNMDEKLTDGMNEALWHIIEHGNLDVLIIEMVSIVPSFLGLMNDILHSNRKQPFKRFCISSVGDKKCDLSSVKNCIRGCPINRSISWVSVNHVGTCIERDDDIRILRMELEANTLLERLDLEDWRVSSNECLYPVIYEDDCEMAVDRSDWSLCYLLQALPGKNLEMLRLNESCISTEPVEQILLHTAKSLPNLKALFLAGCSLRPEFVSSQQFIDVIINHPMLYYLDLSSNYLAEEGCVLIKEIISTNKPDSKNWQLKLRDNSMTFGGLAGVLSDFQSLNLPMRRRTLELDISGNKFTHCEASRLIAMYSKFINSIHARSLDFYANS